MMHPPQLSLYLQRTFRCLALVIATAGLISAAKAAAGGSGHKATQPGVTPPVYEVTVWVFMLALGLYMVLVHRLGRWRKPHEIALVLYPYVLGVPRLDPHLI